jgi:hypothetical protein
MMMIVTIDIVGLPAMPIGIVAMILANHVAAGSCPTIVVERGPYAAGSSPFVADFEKFLCVPIWSKANSNKVKPVVELGYRWGISPQLGFWLARGSTG